MDVSQPRKIKIIYNEDQGLYQKRDFSGGMQLTGSIDVSGQMRANVLQLVPITKSSNYLINTEASVIFGDASSSQVIFTLPNATTHDNFVYNIKKIDSTSNKLIISGTNPSQTIDGNESIDLSIANASVTLISSGSRWFVI